MKKRITSIGSNNKKTSLLLLIAVVTFAAVIFPAFNQSSEAAAGQFYNENNVLEDLPDVMIELTGTETTLNGGTTDYVTYYVSHNISYTSICSIQGKVRIIIDDGCTMTVPNNSNGGVQVKADSTLSVCPREDRTGLLYSTGGNTIKLTGAQSTLINVATIKNDENSYVGRGAIAWTVSLSNISVTNYGIIQGPNGFYISCFVVSTVYNYGEIIGTKKSGIYDPGVVYNYGTIEGADSGIYSAGALTVTNDGTIYGVNYGIMCTSNGGIRTFINYQNGTIEGGNIGINVETAGAKIENDGIITGSNIGINNGYNITLINNNTINGNVSLAGTNTISFGAGSKINGNFSTTAGYKLTFTGTPGDDLTYATITGKTDLTNDISNVFFGDDWVVPPVLHAGDKIVLIGGGTIANSPASKAYSAGGYDFDVSVENGNKLVAIPRLIEIALKDSDTSAIFDSANPYDFATETQGYTPKVLNVTVTNIGNAGTGALSITTAGANKEDFFVSLNSVSNIGPGENYYFTVTPSAGLSPGTYTATITVGPAAGNAKAVNSVSFTVSFTVNSAGPTGKDKNYIIEATSDTGSTITPSGEIVELQGATQNFFFKAKDGYTITEVMIDGYISLTPAEIAGGTYTFTGVMADHKIEVKSTLNSGDSGGKGEKGKTYTVTATADPGSTITPSGKVSVQAGNDQAFTFGAKDGYKITAVSIDGIYSLTQAEIDSGSYSFTIVMSNHTIDVKSAIYSGGDGKGDGGDGMLGYTDNSNVIDNSNATGNSGFPWWIIGLLLLLILAVLLIWFFLFYRRYYDVIKVGTSATIVGKDRAHRKSRYSFKVEGTYSEVSYTIGEEGEKRIIRQTPNGDFSIPKREITDTVTIVAH
ncbi:MAG: hypothetical protein FWC52_02425 [Candidatus Methanoplasma sp.]|nr:hypothetical protein [Candidatus Methanoplasma sp.]